MPFHFYSTSLIILHAIFNNMMAMFLLVICHEREIRTTTFTAVFMVIQFLLVGYIAVACFFLYRGIKHRKGDQLEIFQINFMVVLAINIGSFIHGFVQLTAGKAYDIAPFAIHLVFYIITWFVIFRSVFLYTRHVKRTQKQATLELQKANENYPTADHSVNTDPVPELENADTDADPEAGKIDAQSTQAVARGSTAGDMRQKPRPATYERAVNPGASSISPPDATPTPPKNKGKKKIFGKMFSHSSINPDKKKVVTPPQNAVARGPILKGSAHKEAAPEEENHEQFFRPKDFVTPKPRSVRFEKTRKRFWWFK